MTLEWFACLALVTLALCGYAVHGLARAATAERVALQAATSLDQLRAARGLVQWLRWHVAASGAGGDFAVSAAKLCIREHTWSAAIDLLECARRLPRLTSERCTITDQAMPVAAVLHLADLWLALMRLRWTDAARLPTVLDGLESAIAEIEVDAEAVFTLTEALVESPARG